MEAAHLSANIQVGAGCCWTYLRAFCVQVGQKGHANARIELPQALDLMVGVAGFEPATPASRTQCSTGLSHTPTKNAAYSLRFR
jgi:hypothetical protein